MGVELEQSSSSSSSWRGQGEEKKILMLARNTDDVDLDRLEDGTERNSLGRVDVHIVDLKHNKITPCCLPPLIMIVPSYDLLSLNESVYIVGGVTPPIAELPEYDFQRLQSQSPISNRTYYFGGSSIDSSDEAAVWCPAPVFIGDQSASSNYVSFLGKIYSFGYKYLEPQVLDPAAASAGHSICPLPLPDDLVGCSVSTPVLPDPSKDRILLHLYGGQLSSPSLYAFTPADVDGVGTWKCLFDDFPVWAHSAAVVDGVIYLHCHKFPSLLRAFHIAEHKWLNVWWDSCFEGKADMNVDRIHFDALLPLGDNVLCFAAWTPVFSESDPTGSTISAVFYKFEVLRDTDKTISANACDCYSYELPESNNVLRFISV